MITMFKPFAVLGILTAAVVMTGQSARADRVSVNFGVSVVSPRPVYVAPAPVYVAPAPVYVAPAPVYVAPTPVVTYVTPQYVYSSTTYYTPSYTTVYTPPPVIYRPPTVVYTTPTYYAAPVYRPAGILDFSISIIGGDRPHRR